MSPPELKKIAVKGVSIVVTGKFNPAIVHPKWLQANNALDSYEVAALEPEITGNDDIATAGAARQPQLIVFDEIAQFATASFTINVTRSRFTIQTDRQDRFQAMRDVVLSVTGLLPHTPVSTVGINSYVHVEAWDEPHWHGVGDTFVPKERWKEVMALPGVQALELGGKRLDNLPGEVNVIFRASNTVKPNGLYMEINNHIKLTDPIDADKPATSPMNRLRQILLDDFDRLCNSGHGMALRLIRDAQVPRQ